MWRNVGCEGRSRARAGRRGEGGVPASSKRNPDIVRWRRSLRVIVGSWPAVIIADCGNCQWLLYTVYRQPGPIVRLPTNSVSDSVAVTDGTGRGARRRVVRATCH